MHLQRLFLQNFRNYEELRLELGDGVFGLLGKNGSGKTNLLDAIHYLSFTKSFLNTSDSVNLRTGEAAFSVRGIFSNGEKTNEVLCSFQAGGKKVVREDGQEYSKLSAHIGKYPVVLMAPNDIELIWDGGETRRKFFDGLISQVNPRYLDQLISYTQHLKMRNGALRQFAERGAVDHDLLATYDRVLGPAGDFLHQTRCEFMKSLEPVLLRHYQYISSGQEPVAIEYQSDLGDVTTSELFVRNLQRDILLQRTTTGIHRDDYLFQLETQELKKYGSQGQQKSFLIALKLAEFELLAERKQFKPILLLDDIFDKLDDDRIQRLMEMINQHIFGQVLITDARPDRTRLILEQAHLSATLLMVDSGRVLPW